MPGSLASARYVVLDVGARAGAGWVFCPFASALLGRPILVGRLSHPKDRCSVIMSRVEQLNCKNLTIFGHRILAFLTTTIATAILKTPLDSGTHPLSIPHGPDPDSGAGAEPTPAHGSGRLGGRLGARSQIHAARGTRASFFLNGWGARPG